MNSIQWLSPLPSFADEFSALEGPSTLVLWLVVNLRLTTLWDPRLSSTEDCSRSAILSSTALSQTGRTWRRSGTMSTQRTSRPARRRFLSFFFFFFSFLPDSFLHISSFSSFFFFLLSSSFLLPFIFHKQHPVLITEPALNPKKNKDRTAQMLFETYNAPAVYFAVQAVLSLCGFLFNIFFILFFSLDFHHCLFFFPFFFSFFFFLSLIFLCLQVLIWAHHWNCSGLW